MKDQDIRLETAGPEASQHAIATGRDNLYSC